MRKLSAILTILILTSLLVPAVVAQDPGPVVEANPTGELNGFSAGVSGTGTLWENGEPDGVNGLSSEEGTNVPESRVADDFYLDDACPLYNIDVIRVDLLHDPGILDAGIELYADEGGVPAQEPFFEQWGYDTKTWIGNWFSRDGYEFEFFTPGLQLPPGTYWLSGISWQGTGQGFWLTASPGWGSQIYFGSNYFGYPYWTPGDQVYGAQYNVAFDIDGACAEQEPMYAKIKMLGRMQGGAYVANAIVRIRDAAGGMVEGADVTVFLKKPNGNTNLLTRTTDVFGRTVFPMASPTGGYWLACLEDVQHSEYTWDDSGPKCAFMEFPEP